ncbi:MAG: FMN-dependent NADH-azoreductase [Malacoplasma sp.]|nr:FMN-dependent NADH-azoreductase [Malacoplasma sp.]
MAKVLLIKTSMVEKSKSFSEELANRFVKYYKQFNPNDEIIEMDLNDVEMAQIALNRHNFQQFFNQEHSDKYIDQLKTVNKLIFVCPMTNFNICAVAKNYLDHVLVANKTFSYKYSKKGDAIGLLQHLYVQLLTTQGAPLGWYPWGNHTANLKGTFEFMGATVCEPVLVDGTKIPENANKTPVQRIDEFDSKIKTVANAFASLNAKEYKPII